MTLTRYTFKGEGIFHTLHKAFDEVDMSYPDEQELFDAEEAFERDLEVPDIYNASAVENTAWFTEEGVAWFKDALESLCYLAEIYLGEKIQIRKIDYQGEFLYQDYNQAIIPNKEAAAWGI